MNKTGSYYEQGSEADEPRRTRFRAVRWEDVQALIVFAICAGGVIGFCLLMARAAIGLVMGGGR